MIALFLRFIICNKKEFEMSGQVNYLEKAPKLGQEYYYLYVRENLIYSLFKWQGKDFEQSWLKNHRLYPTKKDVIKAADFLKNYLISHKEQLNCLTSGPIYGTKVWYGLDMDGFSDDYKVMNFNPENLYLQKLLNLSLLYRTSDDLEKAANLITEALALEKKRSKCKL